MANIRRISITSPESDLGAGVLNLRAYCRSFFESELGQIYRAIPWQDLVSVWGIGEKAVGRPSFFSPAGKLGLLFLKHYSCCSDHRLLSQLNGNIHYQLFCGVLIDPEQPLKHRQLVSTIRGELACLLPMEEVQQVLASYWKPYLGASENLLTDATCYESEVRYPTDPKLLWESVSWLYEQLREAHRQLRIRMPRSKYKKWALRYQSYRRKRKPRVKHRRQIKGGLLRLLGKLLGILEELEQAHPLAIEAKYFHRIETIKTVYEQQNQLFLTGEKPRGRIISLAKDYLRPIVRGKEKKPVEFGAKVNKLQIDGINFIEHLSFEAFHEGNRLEKTIFTARKLVGKISRVGADAIYATNANRTYCRKQGIFTDFVPKGRKGKWEHQKKVLRKAITKERVSRLEGSFGNEKNAYHLRRIRARTKENEILWIFLGIHTANAREIGRRINQAASAKQAA